MPVTHTTPADGTFTSAGAVAWNAAHDISGMATAAAVDIVSNALSVLSNTNSAEHAALSGRITSVAGAGGTGSVTSNELSALLASFSVKSVGGTSVRGMQSVLNALSNRISASGGGSGSVTSNELSAAAAALSARDDVVSNAVSIVSQALSVQAAALSVRIDTVSNAASAVSQALSSQAAGLSGRIDTASALATTADTHAGTASAAATSVDGHVNAVSNSLSVANVSIAAVTPAYNVVRPCSRQNQPTTD